MSKKLAVALGLREKLEKDFNNMLADMGGKFKNNQGLFQGFRNTFTAFDGHPDQPEQRKNQVVASTVDEQLAWLKEHSSDFFDTVLSIEKTNAAGATADLIVAGENWGNFSTLELLRLKGILDGKLKPLIQGLPIRPEGQRWKKTTDPVYENREVYEDEEVSGRTKTTIKRKVIVEDPHQKENPNIVRPPVTQDIDTPVETGQYTKQNFSGAITNRQRANMEVLLNNLYKGVIEALEVANSTPLVESELGNKVLNYLLK